MIKVITASAGTGKTYRLSLEYIATLLRYRGISFTEIMIITFTRKATAEIRSEVIKRLFLLLKQDAQTINSLLELDASLELSSANLRFLEETYEQMLTNKENINISTIDAFLGKIFGNLIVPKLNLNGWTLKTEDEEDFITRLFNKFFTKENINIFQHVFFNNRFKSLENYRLFITDLLRSRWLYALSGTSPALEEAPTQAASHLKNYRVHMQKIISLFAEHVRLYNLQNFLLSDYKNFLDENNFAESATELFLTEGLLKRHKELFMKKKLRFYDKRKLKKADATQMETLFSLAFEELSLYYYYLYAVKEDYDICLLAEKLYVVYDELKFQEKTFTHDDISFYTWRYLYEGYRHPAEVINEIYENLSLKIRFLFVDEFQDTSVLQWNILHPLVNELTSGEGVKDYGGAIIVGDKKQAIYRFRGGESALMDSLGSEKQELDTCYRLCGGIMEKVNALFVKLSTSLATRNCFWEYKPVKSHLQAQQGHFAVHFLHLPKKTLKSRLNEGIVSFTEKVILPYLPSLDLSETAILARNNKTLHIIAGVLTAHGVPYVLESSAFLSEHKAIKPLFMLLKAYLYEDVFLLSEFLRSDYVLMPLSELETLLKGKDFKKVLANSENKALSQIRTLDFTQNLPHLCREIMRRFAVSEIFTGEAEAKNIEQFFRLLDDFCEQNETAKDLPSFLNWSQFGEYKQTGLNAMGAIQLLTVHKAKGLGYDNVFIVFLPTKRPINSSLKNYYRFKKDFAAVDYRISTLNQELIIKNAFPQLAEQDDNAYLNEEINNCYVALTRAKFFQVEAYIWDNKDNKEKGIREKITAGDFSVFKELCRQRYLTVEEELVEKNSEHLYCALGNVRQVSKKAEKSNAQLPDICGYYYPPNASEAGDFYDKSVYLGFLRGNIVHFYLAQLKKLREEDFARAKAETLAHFGTMLAEEEYRRLIETAREFAEEHRQLLEAEEVLTEFTVFFENKELRIDRLNIYPDRLVIIDYKTGQITDSSQLDIYEKALRALPWSKGKKIEKVFLALTMK